jgi:hypothetical protein
MTADDCLPDSYSPPGPECVCGGELKAVPLPPGLAALAGQKTLLVHVHNNDTRCYPESGNTADRAATAEPAELLPPGFLEAL